MSLNLINENDYINNLHRKALNYLNEKKFLKSEIKGKQKESQ